MKKIILHLFLCLYFSIAFTQTNAQSRERLFDDNWRFKKDSVDASASSFDDSSWRVLDLPHDWSIEDLPNQTTDTIIGPFSRNSIGKAATGFTVGGTGLYQKKFFLFDQKMPAHPRWNTIFLNYSP